MNLPTALALGRQAGLHLPEDRNILLVGIEAEDVLNFGESCTPAVAAAVPRAVEEVLQDVGLARGNSVPAWRPRVV